MKKRIRTISVVLLDILLINFDMILAFLIRFGFVWDNGYISKYMIHFPENGNEDFNS